ncbi:hypothetical protein HK405_012662, partial [Cladochytrium tenue]
LGIWDAETGARVRKLKGHGSFVNSVAAAAGASSGAPDVLASAADDATVRVWDARQRAPTTTLRLRFATTAVALSRDPSARMLFAGGIDNIVRAWDLRRPPPAGVADAPGSAEPAAAFDMPGHLDTVTGLRVSPDGAQLLSYAMDNTVRTWDVKPFAAGARMLKIFEGAPQGMEKHLLRPCWSNDGSMVAAGAADRSVVIWDTASRNILYKLPGHKGCVTEVDWHPREPVIVSSSNDKTLFL